MMDLRELLARVPVLPVLTIDDLDQAEPLGRALVAGGLYVLEVTLRTPAALPAIAVLRESVPEAMVGAGTILQPEQCAQAHEAGARFAVSPGLSGELAAAARNAGLPLLPGVMTPSEAMQALALGFDTLKLFPANVAGGLAWLRAIHGPLPELAFCPTGGIGQDQVVDYRALPNVLCVGGSWLAPPELVRTGQWGAITRLAERAVATARAAEPPAAGGGGSAASSSAGEEDPGAGVDR